MSKIEPRELPDTKRKKATTIAGGHSTTRAQNVLSHVDRRSNKQGEERGTDQPGQPSPRIRLNKRERQTCEKEGPGSFAGEGRGKSRTRLSVQKTERQNEKTVTWTVRRRKAVEGGKRGQVEERQLSSGLTNQTVLYGPMGTQN